MQYAIRKKHTDLYLNQDGGLGDLQYAYTYSCKHLAEDDANETEEVVSIIKLVYSEEDLNKLMNELSTHKGKASTRLLEELRKL